METEHHSDHFIAAYKRAEDAEDAWTRYRLALSKPDHDALVNDPPKFRALSRLFFGARDPEKLKQYAGMTIDELTQLAADTDAATLAKLDTIAFAETTADLEKVDPARLAAALASLEKIQ